MFFQKNAPSQFTRKILEAQKKVMTVSSKELRSELDQCCRQTEEKETAMRDLNTHNNETMHGPPSWTSAKMILGVRIQL